MAKRSGTKIKNMTAEAQQRRRDQQHQDEVEKVGAAIGLPEIQRRGCEIVLEDVPQISKAGEAVPKTLRKKTRVEMLQGSKALEPYHVAAINLYVGAAEFAYSGPKSCGYGEGGGASPTGAASAAHARQLDRIGEADRYFRAKAALPRPYVTAFERIVLDNHPIGAVGSEMWPGYSAGFVSGSMRELVRTCADAIHIEFEGELGETESLSPHLMKTMVAFDRKVRAATVSDMIRAAVMPSTAALHVSEIVADDIRRENAIDGDLTEFAGLPVVVRQDWRIGWILQDLG